MVAKAETDTSEGWCCDGRTYKEHAHADGKCCQPKDRQIEELPEEGQQAARERLAKEGITTKADEAEVEEASR